VWHRVYEGSLTGTCDRSVPQHERRECWAPYDAHGVNLFGCSRPVVPESTLFWLAHAHFFSSGDSTCIPLQPFRFPTQHLHLIHRRVDSRAPGCVQVLECRRFRIPRLVGEDARMMSKTATYLWLFTSPSRCHITDIERTFQTHTSSQIVRRTHEEIRRDWWCPRQERGGCRWRYPPTRLD
jgi:hypothetical protein